MKILFTGSGSGGHFYPIIAVAEAFGDLVRERKLLEPSLYYAAPTPYDRELLVANGITFVPTAAGKVRRYFSPLNVIDFFKTIWGILRALMRVFFIYPDVVFGTGGYASFPTYVAARFFRIPVVIYAADVDPSRVNLWAGKSAQKIAIAFPESAKHFPKERVAHTGAPVRKAALLPAREGMHEFLKLERTTPVILVLGGSQGAQTLNDAVVSALPQLVKKYQVVHQTGEKNFKEVSGYSKIVLENSEHAARYRPFGYLNDLAIRMSAGAAKLVISRAGSGGIFEIAAWGVPSIIIPLPEAAQDHQSKNAFAYARSGAAVVIEQNNLTAGVLVSEVDRILEKPDVVRTMSEAARGFSRPDAAKAIASAIVDIALSHEN